MNSCIYKFICCRIPGVGCFLICDLYHCESNDFIADLEAFLEDLCNDVFAKCFVFDVHDRVMKLRVKGLACRAKAYDAQLSMTETSWFIVISTPFLNAASCVSCASARSRLSYTGRNFSTVSERMSV